MLKLKKFGSDYDELIDIDERVSIGRDSDNDIIIISNDISRHHCLIAKDESNNIYIKDLGSLNGTFVNNKRIDRILVEHEDMLQVGGEEYVFINVDGTRPVKEEKKPLINLKSILFNEYSKERIEGINIRLIKDDSKELNFPSDSIYTIGRLQICDIVIDDDSVSRTHATIDVRDNRVVITDSNSTNGTFVNNEEVTQKVLKNGDIVGIGESIFIVHFNVVSKKYFSSIEKSTNTITINLLEDIENVIRVYEGEYNKSVLLEVERQSLIFCQEFEHLLRARKSIEVNKKSIVKFIGLLSKSMQIIDPATYKVLTGENVNMDMFTSDYIQLIVGLFLDRRKGKIIYFEETDPDGSTGIKMNGIYVVINSDIQLLLLGIPHNNLLYLIYAANWVSQFYMDVNEKI